jgi:hypothetical protein
MTTGSRRAAGTSDPLDFRIARAVGAPATDTLYGGNIAAGLPGSTLTDATAVTAQIAIAGALLVRLRGLFTAGGTLHFQYLRPAALRPAAAGAGYAYSTAVVPPVGDVTVTANTEFSADITPGGESDLLVTFTPSASGVVTFFDVMQQ